MPDVPFELRKRREVLLAENAPQLAEALKCALLYWRWWIEDHADSVGPTERENFASAKLALEKAKGVVTE